MSKDVDARPLDRSKKWRWSSNMSCAFCKAELLKEDGTLAGSRPVAAAAAIGTVADAAMLEDCAALSVSEPGTPSWDGTSLGWEDDAMLSERSPRSGCNWAAGCCDR